MNHVPPSAPASTRDVLADLLLVVAEVMTLIRAQQVREMLLENAVQLLAEGRADEARAFLDHLARNRPEAAEDFDAVWSGLKSLLQRFAGEQPDA